MFPQILIGQVLCDVKDSSMWAMEVSFNVPEKLQVGATVKYGVRFNTVAIDGFDSSSEIGTPVLPTSREWIEIPVCERVEVEIIHEEHIVLDGDSLGITMPLVPRQPSDSKSVFCNVDTLVIDRAVYCCDTFVGANIVSVRVVGIARDRCLAQLILSPVRYNPVSNKFMVYTNVDALVKYYGVDEDATKELYRHHSPAFAAGVEPINKLSSSRQMTIKQQNNQAIRYLIISHPMFHGYLDEFAEWKRSVGYVVDIAYTDQPEVGTDEQSIKAYVKRQYTEATIERPAPTYLLLVGDVEQLPAFNYSYYMDYYGYVEHVSDLNYACWTDDNIPDCYIGRLSSQNVRQLQTQLQKILMYERYEFPDPSFLDKAVLVAGVDGGYEGDHGYTHADPAMDYAAKLYFNGYNGFRLVKEFKNNTVIDPHSPNVRVSPNTSEYTGYIRSLYSEGAGWINYSAHGQWNRWDNPLMMNEHVLEMTNRNKCGVMVGNCCLTAKFDEPECFAEALLRIGDNCGAVAYIGGSNSTYWNEDFYWAVGVRYSIGGGMSHEYTTACRGAYDNIFHTHGESYSQWASTMGSMLMSGNMSVENSSSDIKNYYWQIYHLFGDPSMMPWLSQAKEMQLSYSGADEGSEQLYVTTAPYAYVAVTDDNNTLIGTAFADQSGRATVDCSVPIEHGNMKLSSIAQSYKPKLVTISQSESIREPISNGVDSKIEIFPNPTKGVIYIEGFSGNNAYLYSATGRLVSKFDCSISNSLDLSLLPNGVYFFKTTDGRTAKVVKQ